MVTRARKRYYVHAEGPDEDAMRFAFAWLLESVKRSQAAVTALLAIPVKDNLRGIITKVIGDKVARYLASGKAVPIEQSASDIFLITQRIEPTGWRGGPVLAAYPTKELLDILDDIYGVTEILIARGACAERSSCGPHVSIQYWISAKRHGTTKISVTPYMSSSMSRSSLVGYAAKTGPPRQPVGSMR